MNYGDKLKDPRWQRRRLEIMQRDNFRCLVCMEETKTLHVHHNYYLSGREPWDYPDECLITVCEGCHEYEHLYREQCERNLINIIRQKGIEYIDVQLVSQAFANMTKAEIHSWALDNNSEEQVFKHCSPIPRDIEGMIK
jgi:hypothetical protein